MLHLVWNMRKIRQYNEIPVKISPVLEKATGNSDGYFGFTCHYSSGRFENIIINYQFSGRDLAWTEITNLHNHYNQKTLKGDKS